jgi:hypothetical protein
MDRDLVGWLGTLLGVTILTPILLYLLTGAVVGFLVVVQLTAPFNVTGHPAISIPCGFVDGLPVGLMLVGNRFDDGAVLRVADAFEQTVGWDGG